MYYPHLCFMCSNFCSIIVIVTIVCLFVVYTNYMLDNTEERKDSNPSLNKQKNKKMNQIQKSISVGRLVFLIFALGFIICIAVFFSMLEPNIRTPLFVDLDTNRLQNPIHIVLDKNGEQILDSTTRVNINLEKDINPYTIDAFICTEDRRFFEHKGIDNVGMMRSLIKNILGRGYLQGGSTITQQIAKNTHLTNQKKIGRKINELRIARSLERKYSKNELLNIYFDMLYFGYNIYGLGTAANAFFGKSVRNLTIAESAYLVAIINSPKLYNPYRFRDNLEKRKNLVVEQMYKFEKISKKEYEMARNEFVNFLPYNTAFVQTNNLLQSQLTINEKNIAKNDECSIPIIQTTIDSELTILAKNLLNEITPKGCESSVYCINNDGSILFVHSTSGVNIAKHKRNIGSTIKPILCYAPALEECLISPLTPINDSKMRFNGYSPSNYGDKYLGYTTVSKALASSSNIVAVQILHKLGIENAQIHAKGFGLDFNDIKDNNLGIALGGTADGYTLPQLVHAYSTFANMGIFRTPKIIPDQPQSNNPIIRTDTAHLMNNMLRECVMNGTARRLKPLPYEICAKTGTTGTKSHNTDAYCIAYTAEHTIGVWIGGDNMSNHITGGTLPTDITKLLLQNLYSQPQITFPKKFPKSNQVKTLYIDTEEFYRYHRLTKAPLNSLDKDKIKGEFSIFYLPSNNINLVTKKEYSQNILFKSSQKNLPHHSICKQDDYEKILDHQIKVEQNPFYYFEMLKN